MDTMATLRRRHEERDEERRLGRCRMYMRRLCRTGGDTWQCVNGRMRGNEERELAAIYLLGETGMLKSYFHMILPNEDRDYIRNAIAAMREYGNL